MNINLGKLSNKIVLVLLFIIPIYFYHSRNFGFQTMRVTQEQFFQISCLSIFSLLIPNLYLSLLMALTVTSYFLYNFTGGQYLMNISCFVVGYYALRKFMTHENMVKFLRLLMWLFLLHITWMLLQFLNFETIFINIREQGFVSEKAKDMSNIVGIMGLKAVSGMLAAIMVPVLFYFNPYLALCAFVPLYHSECSSALVAGAFAYLFCMYYRSKKIFFALLAIGVIASGFYVKQDYRSGMFEDRFNLWKVSLRDAFIHPVLGYGLDSYRSQTPFKNFMYFKNVRTRESIKGHMDFKTGVAAIPPDQRKNTKDDDTLDGWDNAHNEFVQVVFEFGILGLILAILFIKSLFKAFKRSIKTVFDKNMLISCFCVFLVFFIMSIGQFPFHLARIVFIFMVCLAIFDNLTEKELQNV